jgi:hypothetical protein
MFASNGAASSASAKRKSEDPPAVDGQSVDVGTLRSLLGDMFGEQNKSVGALVAQTVAAQLAPVELRLKSLEEAGSSTDARLAAMEAKLEQHTETNSRASEELQRSISASHLGAGAGSGGGGGGGGGPAAESAGNSFNRAIDPTILCINTEAPVSLQSALVGAHALCTRAGIQTSSVEVTCDAGIGLGKFFTYRFGGTDLRTGTLQANKARSCLKTGPKTFEDLFLKTPDNIDTKAYINPDRNPKMRRTRLFTKKLHDVIKEIQPNPKWFADQSSGEIKWGWTPVAVVVVESFSKVSLDWNQKAVARFDIPKAEIVAAFNDATEDAANVEWGP